MKMSQEQVDRFVEWAVKEFEVGLRMMLREDSTIHLFDFDGTTDGKKEPWSFLIACAPKATLAPLEKALGSRESQPV